MCIGNGMYVRFSEIYMFHVHYYVKWEHCSWIILFFINVKLFIIFIRSCTCISSISGTCSYSLGFISDISIQGCSSWLWRKLRFFLATEITYITNLLLSFTEMYFETFQHPPTQKQTKQCFKIGMCHLPSQANTQKCDGQAERIWIPDLYDRLLRQVTQKQSLSLWHA